MSKDVKLGIQNWLLPQFDKTFHIDKEPYKATCPQIDSLQKELNNILQEHSKLLPDNIYVLLEDIYRNLEKLRDANYKLRIWGSGLSDIIQYYINIEDVNIQKVINTTIKKKYNWDYDMLMNDYIYIKEKALELVKENYELKKNISSKYAGDD